MVVLLLLIEARLFEGGEEDGFSKEGWFMSMTGLEEAGSMASELLLCSVCFCCRVPGARARQRKERRGSRQGRAGGG